MKRLKIGIVAIAALAVMSFTVVSHAGVVNKKHHTCYAGVTAIDPGTGMPTLIPQGASGCPPFTFTCAIIGTVVQTTTCNGGTFFCCVNLASPACTVSTFHDGLSVTPAGILCQNHS